MSARCDLLDQSLTTSDDYSPTEENTGQRSTNDGTIYANVSEIETKKRADFIDRQPVPPRPSANQDPIRVMQNGWREYKTLGGRFVLAPYGGMTRTL